MNSIVLMPSDLAVIDSEPRVQDIRLAKVLGFEVPRRIRDLIKRHTAALSRLGAVCTTVVQTSKSGGRPGKEYLLNKKQALFICTKSETANATEATIQMVEVFDAWQAGTLVPKSVTVKAHTRCISPARPVPALPPIAQDGIGVVRMGGEFVVFDTTAYDVPDGTEVLAIRAGDLIVTKVRREPDNQYDDHDYRRRGGWVGMRPHRYLPNVPQRCEIRIVGRVLGRISKELALPGGRGDYFFLKNVELNTLIGGMADEIRALRRTVGLLAGPRAA